MPYWIRRVYAGKTVEIKKYYSRKHKPKEKRAKTGEPSRPEQYQKTNRAAEVEIKL